MQGSIYYTLAWICEYGKLRVEEDGNVPSCTDEEEKESKQMGK